jgi:hypothetical protein
MSAGIKRDVHATGLALLFTALAPAVAVEPQHARDPNTGAESWEIRAHGVSLKLAQILPDQVRGFYLARGFDTESVELMATRHCFFQTILRNESGTGPIHFDLAEWRTRTAAAEQRLKLVADWLPEWERRGVPQPARIAFRWALFPSEQSYEVGDWNMGMTTYSLPLGSRFDLEAVWQMGGDKRRKLVLTGVRCAADAVPERKAEER